MSTMGTFHRGTDAIGIDHETQNEQTMTQCLQGCAKWPLRALLPVATGPVVGSVNPAVARGSAGDWRLWAGRSEINPERSRGLVSLGESRGRGGMP
jgi:hypothetical protein